MTTLTLIRHGQTDWNLQHRIQGSSDIPLNDTGRAQAAEAGHSLVQWDWDGIYSSPLSRAFETASIITDELGLGDPIVLEGVQERNYGEAEGLTSQQIVERFPDTTAVRGRETNEQLLERVMQSLTELAEAHPDESLLVVSHGGVIGAVSRFLTGGMVPSPGELIPNGSAHQFEWDGTALHLRRYNLTDVESELRRVSPLV